MHIMRRLVLLLLLTSHLHAEGISILDVKSRGQTQSFPGAPSNTLPPVPTSAVPPGVPMAPGTPWAPASRVPLVYYIMCPTGDDESYFEALARGTPANIWNLCQSDAAAAQAASGAGGAVQFVRVKVSSLEDYTRVLHEGLMPRARRAGTPVYRVEEMSPQPNRVLGFAILSHAGCDGPFIPLENKRGVQAPYPIFAWDKASGGNSFYERLVPGARIRFCGCNTGNDYMWYEVDQPGYRANPSVAHATAAILADKRVVVYGKYNSGDVKGATYVHFSCPQGQSYPVRHVKAKNAYSFGTTKGASQYEPALIHYQSAEERDAYIAYYRERGYPLVPSKEQRSGGSVSGDLVLRAPRPQWFSNGSAKPAVLKDVVRMLEAYPGAPSQAVQYAFAQHGEGGKAYLGMVPRLIALAAAGHMRRAIDDTKRAHGGQLDLDDMRLWVTMFGPEHHYTAWRADLCDDPTVARTPFHQ